MAQPLDVADDRPRNPLDTGGTSRADRPSGADELAPVVTAAATGSPDAEPVLSKAATSALVFCAAVAGFFIGFLIAVH